MDSQFLTAPHWEKIGVRQHHGICIALSSLITAESSGIGEYLDLIPLINWLAQTGFDTIQLLPINDTNDDPSPYMGISGSALHPIYLSLKALPGVSELPQKDLGDLASLNTTNRVEYHSVLKKKLAFLSIYLDHYLETIQEDPEYHAFIKKNNDWLVPYSIFRTLKNAHNGEAWWDWKQKKQKKETLCHDDTHLADEVMRWRAIQFLCYSQFKEVKEAADQSGVLIKGDIPILINKDSADVWWNPDLFILDASVGAPPDMYNQEGQYWGFPLYNWKNHEQEDFAWWKQRLRSQEDLFHLFRLDHLVGFFRFWTVPKGQKASQGKFVPDTSEEWKRQGENILSHIIQATSMLPIGEDLGDVPDLVRASMQKLGVPGVKVMRWERYWHTDRTFIPPEHYSPESLTTLSTHDSSLMSAWWSDEPEASQQMAHDYHLTWTRTLCSSLLYDLLNLSHHSRSLFHINLFNEYLMLVPELSWQDPEQERINVPGVRSKKNWTYRLKKPLEKIISNRTLFQLMKNLSYIQTS